MDLGVGLPTSYPLASPEAILRIAQEAEDLGYAAVWTFERLLYALGDVPQPGGPPRPLPKAYRSVYEPVETLSWLAARTSTIKLGTSVLDAPFHNPVLLGRRLATLDRLSGGRVIAGFGQGWMDEEFVAAGVTKEHFPRRVREFVSAIRAVWGPDPVSFDGRFYRIPESLIDPKPAQAGGIQILMGVFAPAAIRRAGRIADGFNPIAISYEWLVWAVEQFRNAAGAAGRDAGALKVIVRANVPVTEEPIMDGRPYLGGSPEQIAGDLEALDGLRVDQVFFSNNSPAGLEEHVKILGSLKRAVEG